MPHKVPVSPCFVKSDVLLPFQLDVEIVETSFDVTRFVVPGRKQIAATDVPGLS